MEWRHPGNMRIIVLSNMDTFIIKFVITILDYYVQLKEFLNTLQRKN